jgi:hypothetical protein
LYPEEGGNRFLQNVHATQHYNPEYHNLETGHSLSTHFISHTENKQFTPSWEELPIHVKGQENWTSVGKVITLSQQSYDNPKNEICKYYSKF